MVGYEKIEWAENGPALLKRNKRVQKDQPVPASMFGRCLSFERS